MTTNWKMTSQCTFMPQRNWLINWYLWNRSEIRITNFIHIEHRWTRAQIGTPYHNPSMFFCSYIIMQSFRPVPSPQKKSGRVCEILIRDKNPWGYQYDSSLHFYIRQKELTGWFFLKNFISPKNYSSWSCFLQPVVTFFSARVDTKQTDYEADLAIYFM